MDSLYLLDRAEDAVAGAPAVPLTRYALVDREELLALFDQVRTALPPDLQVTAVPRDACAVIDGSADLADARRRAAAIVREAEEEATSVRAEADVWAARRLQHVADELDRAIRAGATLEDDLHRSIGDLRRSESPRPATAPSRPSRPLLGLLAERAHAMLTS